MRLPLFLRRGAIALMYGAYPAAVFLHWQLHASGQKPQLDDSRGIVLIVLAALFVIGTLLLAGTPYLGWAGAQRRTLDEREDAARNRAYHFAYHVITWLGILLLLVLAAGNFVSINSGLAYVLLGYVFLMFTLPGAVLAWKDRPPQ